MVGALPSSRIGEPCTYSQSSARSAANAHSIVSAHLILKKCAMRIGKIISKNPMQKECAMKPSKVNEFMSMRNAQRP